MTATAATLQLAVSADSEDSVDADMAAKLLGLSLSTFNAARRELQLVRDRATGRLLPYPDHSRDHLGNVLMPAECARRRKEFDAASILVVPEWGGIKWPRSSWTYSRCACIAARGGQGAAERPD